MKLVFSKKKDVVVSMACHCQCVNSYASYNGRKIIHKR